MKTYTFYVSLPMAPTPIWRKMELSADQTLAILHLSIQDAFDFDNDHLYSFFMSGEPWDGSTEYSLPEGVAPWDTGEFIDDEESDELDESSPTDASELTPEEYEQLLQKGAKQSGLPIETLRSMVEMFQGMHDQFGDGIFDDFEGGDVRTAKLDDLNLSIGQEFLYLFDYGDQWEFTVRVRDINSDAPEGKYPRIIEAVGESPEQYPSWDDEDDEWDEEWDDENIIVMTLPGNTEALDEPESADEAPPIEITPVVKASTIPPQLKKEVLGRGNAFIAKQLKNVITDAELSVKWQGRFFYFSARQGKLASFARLEYIGADRFNLFERYRDGWYEAYRYITLDECLEIIKHDENFRPTPQTPAP